MKRAVTPAVGANGARLKHFERVVADLLSVPIEPKFSQLLPPLNEGQKSLFNDIDNDKKEQQVASLLRCILPLLKPSSIVVDFGGGSGHLSIPLAKLRPDCVVVCVDLDPRRLEQLHATAKESTVPHDKDPVAPNYSMKLPDRHKATALRNLYTFHGPAQEYVGVFHVAVALHLCGEATDVALRLAGEAGAMSIVAAPCCVGKTSARVSDPHRFKATGQNDISVPYPQSNAFCQVIKVEDWNALAKAADCSDISHAPRNSVRRTAKALLETDRIKYLEETFGYRTALTRIEPWEATPKNDIIIAWDATQYDECPLIETGNGNDESSADLLFTKEHLFGNTENSPSQRSMNPPVDWSHSEEKGVRQILDDVCSRGSRSPYVFAADGMGSRKRKLVHSIAEELGLKHWSLNSPEGKTVAVVPYLVPRNKLNQFKEQGAVVIRNVLTQSELRLLEEGISYNLEHPGHLAGVASSDSDSGRFLEDFCNWTRIKAYESIMKDSFLPFIAARLMESRTVRIFHDHLLVKEPSTTQETPFHQDQPYYNISGVQNVSFWIPIDPVPRQSSLQFVPGSHAPGKWYLPRTFLTDEAKWFPEGCLPDVPFFELSDDLLAWDVQPGDVVAFHMLTIHGAPGSKTLRRAFSARYIGDDAKHAPRTWKTSPEFPSDVKETVQCGEELDHPLFPIVYQAKP